MLNKTTTPLLMARAAVTVAVLSGWFPAGAVPAQEAKKVDNPASAAGQSDDRPLFVAYALKHSDVTQALAVLQTCLADLDGCKVSADAERNMLIVLGNREAHDQVEQILQTIDQPRQDNAQIKIFYLEHLKSDDIAKVLGVLTDTEDVRVSVDAGANRLIVSGTPETLKIVEAIVSKLDEATPTRSSSSFGPSTTFVVRLVWLATGPDAVDGDDPAEDLEPVLAVLAKEGVKDVRQIAKTTVNTGLEGQFSVKCRPVYGERPADWTIDGQLEEGEETLKLHIKLSISRDPLVLGIEGKAIQQSVATGLPKEELVDLETDLALPEASSVILGIAPTGKTQSIFVVQTVAYMQHTAPKRSSRKDNGQPSK